MTHESREFLNVDKLSKSRFFLDLDFYRSDRFFFFNIDVNEDLSECVFCPFRQKGLEYLRYVLSSMSRVSRSRRESSRHAGVKTEDSH